MPTYGLALIAVALGLIAVAGGRGIAYAMDDDDWLVGLISLALGLFFSVPTAIGIVGIYTGMVHRHATLWIIGAAVATVAGSVIVWRLFRAAALGRRRDQWAGRRLW